jgi:hypothetical protein
MFRSRSILKLYLTLAVQYPKICREEVTIHVIQSREHILNTVRELRVKYKIETLL